MRFDSPKPLTMAQQYLHLRANPACTGEGRLRGGGLTWAFPIAPTPFSRCYAARLEYRQGSSPEIFIDGPDLPLLAEGRRLPHVYQQSPPCLCLYLPGSGEWTPWMRVDQTLIPWTALWLFYFEEWLVSGVWAGGGEHPVKGEPNRRRASHCIALQSNCRGRSEIPGEAAR